METSEPDYIAEVATTTSRYRLAERMTIAEANLAAFHLGLTVFLVGDDGEDRVRCPRCPNQFHWSLIARVPTLQEIRVAALRAGRAHGHDGAADHAIADYGRALDRLLKAHPGLAQEIVAAITP